MSGTAATGGVGTQHDLPDQNSLRAAAEAGPGDATETHGPAPHVSFVIPAYNEERFIPATLESIRRVSGERYGFEIIVVDNGSTDRTAQLARAAGANTYVVPAVSVAALRNYGAERSRGNVLVFLDADVELTTAWGDNIGAVLSGLSEAPLTVTGSQCGIPQQPSWLEKYWFAPSHTTRLSHLNSGHLIVPRLSFEKIGGFRADLDTGEDYEFSVRAVRRGARLINNASLAVVHHGYPRTLRAFMRREVWHGRSDVQSLDAIVRSRVAIAALLFLALHTVAITALVLNAYVACATAVAGVLALCLASAIRKCRGDGARVILSSTAIYYFYFWARAIALVRVFSRRHSYVPRDGR